MLSRLTRMWQEPNWLRSLARSTPLTDVGEFDTEIPSCFFLITLTPSARKKKIGDYARRPRNARSFISLPTGVVIAFFASDSWLSNEIKTINTFTRAICWHKLATGSIASFESRLHLTSSMRTENLYIRYWIRKKTQRTSRRRGLAEWTKKNHVVQV